jgi:hypothetical protein
VASSVRRIFISVLNASTTFTGSGANKLPHGTKITTQIATTAATIVANTLGVKNFLRFLPNPLLLLKLPRCLRNILKALFFLKTITLNH